MRIRSAGFAALVAAAGIWVGFSGEPAMAAKSTAKTAKAAKTSVAAADRPIVLSKFKKQRAHAAKKSRTAQTKHARKAASKASSKAKVLAQKSADKPPGENKVLADANNGLPVSVANARAQALADDEARNIAALDSTDVVVGMKLAAADQLTDADRAATADAVVAQDLNAPAPPAVSPPPASAPSNKILRPVSTGDKPVLKTDDSDPWSKTSLIGKIFIAFGSLLTLASAARLLIA